MKKILNYFNDELPKEIAELAIKNYNPTYSFASDKDYKLERMFSWQDAEGTSFWNKINMGEYEHFYKLFPKSVDGYSII